MSARTACGDARVLDLDRDLAAVVQPRAVDLADRGGGDRLGSNVGEDLVQRLLELGLDHLAHVVEAHLRRRVAQRAELALELLAVLLGHEPDVEEAHHLAELHRRALHRPQRGDDLLGRLDVAALERLLACPARSGRGSPPACRAGAPPGRRRAPRPARCGDPRGRDPVLRHGRTGCRALRGDYGVGSPSAPSSRRPASAWPSRWPSPPRSASGLAVRGGAAVAVGVAVASPELDDGVSLVGVDRGALASAAAEQRRAPAVAADRAAEDRQLGRGRRRPPPARRPAARWRGRSSTTDGAAACADRTDRRPRRPGRARRRDRPGRG